MAAAAWRGVGAVALLLCSNGFMTTAWYLHLKLKEWPMVKAIVVSWGIAFFEYCLQVPANRLGHVSQGGPLSAPQLKVLQEFISLAVFALFSAYVLRERLRWTDAGAFALIFAGVVLSLSGKLPAAEGPAGGPVAAAAGQPPGQQPPPRGLLEMGFKYQRLVGMGSEEGGGEGERPGSGWRGPLRPLPSEPFEGRGSGLEAGEVPPVAVLHTGSELAEAGELHRRDREQPPQQGKWQADDQSEDSSKDRGS